LIPTLLVSSTRRNPLDRISATGTLNAAWDLEEHEMHTEQVNQAYGVASSLRTSERPVKFNDEQLVAEAQCGSPTAFEQLFERHKARVLRLANRIARRPEDAEEITQNAFAQAFKHLPHFRGDSRFYTWLARITVNEGLMKTRRHRMNEISIDDFTESELGAIPRELTDWRPTPERRCSQQELRDILAATIGQLPLGNRTVFQLRDVEGFSTEETAETLALSSSAVKTRLRRARLQLRQSLSKHFKPMSGQMRFAQPHSGNWA
jgi:RNA polymerase sigma-70 factor, ECF subfamily